MTTWPVAAICQKSLGSLSRSTLSLRQSSFLPFPLVDSPRGLGSARSPAPNILMQFIQTNSLIKSTLMFNVGLLQKSACIQSSATVGRTDTMDYRPCIAAYGTKKWGSVHIWTPSLAESDRGVRTPGPPQDRRQCTWQFPCSPDTLLQCRVKSDGIRRIAVHSKNL